MSRLLLALTLFAVPLTAAAAVEVPSVTSDSDATIQPAGTVGLSFGLFSPGTTSVGASYFVNPNGALRVDLGLDINFTSFESTNFLVQLGYRAYLARRGAVAAFAQPSFYFSRENKAQNIAVAGGVGLEYFFAERLSVSGILALAFQVGNIGGTGDVAVKLNTGTSGLFGTFYF